MGHPHQGLLPGYLRVVKAPFSPIIPVNRIVGPVSNGDRVLDFTYKGPHNIMENVIKEICCMVNPVLLECNRIDVKLCSAEGKRRLRH
jgi:hypothetical protein